MNSSYISTLRLYNQQIIQSKLKDPNEVLVWLGAIQGQDYVGAKWSIGLRLAKATDADIEHALTSKRILRTWLMRGTLHLVAAEDIEWMRVLMASRIISGNARRYKELELDTPTLAKSNDLLVKALQGQMHLNRKELLAFLEKNGISTKGQRAAYMLQRASYDGLICQTNMVRNSPNYILIEKSFSGGKAFDRNEAVAELTKRYFKSRGPATIQDFVWWSGLTVTDAKNGLEANKPFLIPETFEGQTFWLSPEIQDVKKDKPSILMFPGFDEFLLGYKDRSASLDPQHNTKWCPGNNGMFFHFIVVDGRVIGTWKRTFKKEGVAIEIKNFDPACLMDATSIAKAASHYCKFMDMKLIS